MGEKRWTVGTTPDDRAELLVGILNSFDDLTDGARST